MERVQTRGTPCPSSPKFPNPLVFTLPKHTSICHKTNPDRTWHKISKHSQGTFRSACWWWLKCGFTNTYNNTHHKPLEQWQIFKQQTNNWNTKAATVLGSPTIGAYTNYYMFLCKINRKVWVNLVKSKTDTRKIDWVLQLLTITSRNLFSRTNINPIIYQSYISIFTMTRQRTQDRPYGWEHLTLKVKDKEICLEAVNIWVEAWEKNNSLKNKYIKVWKQFISSNSTKQTMLD